MELTPDGLSIRDRYKILIGAIVPRPVGFVSTISIDGRLNLAPFSFFNGVGSNPMTLLFCPANTATGGEKNTLINCKPVDEGGTGQFVVNAAVESYARQVAAAAEELPFGESEFELTGLTPSPSVKIRPPRIKESPVCFECETMQVIRTNPGEPSGGNIVIGRVVHLFVRDDVIDERFHIDPDALRAIARMGGAGYARTRDRYEMPSGRGALSQPPIDDA
jgi:flavin reductase (DIM6/NTAB) family NADH-FMN oxidoreductase RutF